MTQTEPLDLCLLRARRSASKAVEDDGTIDPSHCVEHAREVLVAARPVAHEQQDAASPLSCLVQLLGLRQVDAQVCDDNSIWCHGDPVEEVSTRSFRDREN